MNEFEIVNEYNYQENYDYLNDVINHTLEKLQIKKAYLSIIFIDDKKMHEMNKNYRGIDRTTDVLSFFYFQKAFLMNIALYLESALTTIIQNSD